MRTKLLLSTLLLFFLINTSYGQGFVFRVLASKGENKVKKGENGETLPLKTGATLMSGDELIAASGAYIGLMHKTGRTIEVRNPGVTKISDLETKLASSQSSVANKYAQFVMNKMNEDDGDVNQNYRSNMKATGAVTRAVDGTLNVMLPSSVDVLNAEAIVQWTAPENVENPTYVVSIMNIFDEEIFSTETDKNTIPLNFDDENLSSERLVILKVKVKGNNELVSGDYGIKRMSSDDAASITENLNALKAEVPMDDSPLNRLVYASFYEENNLILDAITQYQKAITLSPDVEDFQTMYTDFLIKNNLQ
jgi:hypothetical protein